MTLGHDETTQYSPMRHFASIVDDIANGRADAIAASNLLAGIADEEVVLSELPIPLSVIEEVAGRKLGDPIA
jgi:hypothetical protein